MLLLNLFENRKIFAITTCTTRICSLEFDKNLENRILEVINIDCISRMDLEKRTDDKL